VVRAVLIVDDHGGFRSVARTILEAGGFEVIGAVGDGRAAILASRRLRPDLVLLDVHLPDIDGTEVARRLTAHAGGPAVILTSSREPCDFGPRLLQCGARGFIRKVDLSGPALRGFLRERE
jgi:DNA-binding NarL/FixJ family response regulator